MLGARMHRRIGFSIIWLLGVAAAPALNGDIVGESHATFEQRFSESKIVALARVEAAAIGSSSSQIYRVRVTVPFKGVENDRVLYFWGGNAGSAAYGVGQVYLLMLRNSWKPVADVLASFAPAAEPLLESVCLNSPILVWRSTASPPPPLIFPGDQSIFLFGCPEPPLALHPRSLAQPMTPFHSWVPHDDMVEYLTKLASPQTAKSHAGA